MNHIEKVIDPNKMLKYKAVLFDLDGTLLDTRKGVLTAVRRTIDELDLPLLTPEELNSFVGPPMQWSFKKFYEMKDEDALCSANLFRENYRKHSLFEAELYPYVIETLTTLRGYGYRLAVATNKSQDNALSILKHFNLYELCDYAKGSDLTGKLTKADIVTDCISALKCNPSETVFVGDSDIDLDGARSCNIDFIGVTYGFGFDENSVIISDNLIGVIKEFRALLKLLCLADQGLGRQV